MLHYWKTKREREKRELFDFYDFISFINKSFLHNFTCIFSAIFWRKAGERQSTELSMMILLLVFIDSSGTFEKQSKYSGKSVDMWLSSINSYRVFLIGFSIKCQSMTGKCIFLFFRQGSLHQHSYSNIAQIIAQNSNCILPINFVSV